jgi:atypical dual specificity phosphatase
MSNLQVVVHSSGYTSIVGTSFFTSLLSALEPLPSSSSNTNSRHGLHITLLTKSEAASLKSRGVRNPFEGAVFTEEDVVLVGLGGDERQGIGFAVVLINRANVIRRKAGLPLKNFHISLSTPPSASPEDFPHDLSTLRRPLDMSALTSPTLLDALAHHYLLSSDFLSSFAAASRLCVVSLPSPSAPKPFLRLADASYRLKSAKLAMLAYGRAFELADEGAAKNYALKQLYRCSAETEWGTTWYERDWEQFEGLHDGLREELLKPWSEELREAIRSRAQKMDPPTLCIEAEDRLTVQHQGQDERMMRNFVRLAFRFLCPFFLTNLTFFPFRTSAGLSPFT